MLRHHSNLLTSHLQKSLLNQRQQRWRAQERQIKTIFSSFCTLSSHCYHIKLRLNKGTDSSMQRKLIMWCGFDIFNGRFRRTSRNVWLSLLLEWIVSTCWFVWLLPTFRRPFPETHRVNIMPIIFLSTGCVDIFTLCTPSCGVRSRAGVSQPGRFIRESAVILTGLLWLILIWPDCGSPNCPSRRSY